MRLHRTARLPNVKQTHAPASPLQRNSTIFPRKVDAIWTKENFLCD